ncbi:MAG TPA: amino acid adenylation domain-containing protein [Thermoanaerobaculia bacterium]
MSSEYPVAGLLPDLVAARAAGQPDAVALVAGDEIVRYGELDAWAERLAARLRRRGVGPETVVGVLLERSPAMVAALLAIWKCGGAYLPLDPEHPAERMAYILGDGLRGPGGRTVVTAPELAGRIPGPDVERFLVDGAEAEPTGFERPVLLPDHLAYVIYTSGSTGHPKGTAVSHRAIANRILWAVAAEMRPGDAFLHKTTLTFDVSLPEIFGPLVVGGRCVLARPGGQRDLAGLADLIARESITHASFPPATLRLLLELPDAAAKLRSLRVFVTGGETVPPDLPARARAVVPAATLYNRYGPTEATVSVLSGACDPESKDEIVSLGRPIARARVYVLDETMCLQPPGIPGEIHIGGVCLARGYVGRPDLTAERFVPDPIGGETGERLYRTGDRARLRPDGAVEFLGRVDHQVKIRGFRVEIEEVEAALNACPGVREAAVAAVEEAATGSRRLLAWVLPEEGAAFDAGALRRQLAGRLAEYMIPSAFVPCADFPRTLSGKVDRPGLIADWERAGRAAPGEAADAPRTPLERALVRLVEELLQVLRVGISDHLLDLGFHSLLLARLQARLRETVGAEVPLADLVRNPSVEALARFLEAGGRGAEIGPEALAAEAALEPEIRPGPSAVPAEPETIFLTGATGFLGAHLLAELLAGTSARALCLVRGADGGRALRHGLERYGLWREELEPRIVPLPGDLSRPRLGLSASAFAELAATADAVYHCGAQVNYAYPYEALRAANVEGTREILRLTVQGRPKTLHHVSTLAVLEREGERPAVPMAEEPLDGNAAGIAGGYRQSKWVAERLVQAAIGRGVPAAIYRPGWITGGSRTGAFNPEDFLSRLVIGSLQAGLAPELGPVEVCPTPVDWVAAAIARLSRRPESAGGAFHLINPHPVAVDEIVEGARDLGYSLRSVPLGRWAADLADLAETGGSAPLAPLAGFLRQLAAGPAERSFQPTRFAGAVALGALECPRLDRRLLELYLDRLSAAAESSSGALLRDPGHGHVLLQPARLGRLENGER